MSLLSDNEAFLTDLKNYFYAVSLEGKLNHIADHYWLFIGINKGFVMIMMMKSDRSRGYDTTDPIKYTAKSASSLVSSPLCAWYPRLNQSRKNDAPPSCVFFFFFCCLWLAWPVMAYPKNHQRPGQCTFGTACLTLSGRSVGWGCTKTEYSTRYYRPKTDDCSAEARSTTQSTQPCERDLRDSFCTLPALSC